MHAAEWWQSFAYWPVAARTLLLLPFMPFDRRESVHHEPIANGRRIGDIRVPRSTFPFMVGWGIQPPVETARETDATAQRQRALTVPRPARPRLSRR